MGSFCLPTSVVTFSHRMYGIEELVQGQEMEVEVEVEVDSHPTVARGETISAHVILLSSQ